MQKDLYAVTETWNSIDVAGSEIVSYRQKHIKKQIARVFFDQQYVLMAAVGSHTPKDLWSKAEKLRKTALPQSYPPPKIKSADFYKPSALVDSEHFTHQVKALLTKVKNEFPQFIVQGKFNQTLVERQFLQIAHQNANDGEQLNSRHGIVQGYFYFKFKSSPNIIDHECNFTGSPDLDFLNFLDRQKKYLAAWDKPAVITNGVKNVCFFADNSELLAKLHLSLDAEAYHHQACLYAGQKGKQVFHADLTIIDHGDDFSQGLYRPFDDEGVRRNMPNREVVKEGVFTGPLYDLRTAHKYQTIATGNAYRSLKSSTRTHAHLGYAAGKHSLNEWLEKLGETIVVLMIGGGDTTDDGEFSTPAHVAFLVKDGKVQGRLPMITLQGQIRDILGENFIGTAKENYFSGNPRALLTRMNVLVN
jgi:PmbA protein